MRHLPLTRFQRGIMQRFILPLLFSIVCLFGASIARAAITTSGDVEPANPAGWDDSTAPVIGNTKDGSLRVDSGDTIRSRCPVIGFNYHVAGVATVDGAGSAWTNTQGLVIGASGQGTLNITNGGTVVANGAWLGQPDGVGVVVVDGKNSTWSNGSQLYVGVGGEGSLTITNGGAVSDTDGEIAYGAGKGVVAVDGTGSNWTNTYSLVIGYGYLSGGTGTLSITGGGTVSAPIATVYAGSLLAIDVGHGSSLTVANGNGTISNYGPIRLLAGASATGGGIFSPINAAYLLNGCQAVGGKWNAAAHTFTASNVQAGPGNSQISIDPSTIQRMLITDSTTQQSVGASFLAAATTGKQINLLATTMSGTPLSTLQGLLAPGQSVLSAWNFSVTGTGYNTNDPAYLSFGVGAGYNRNNLEVWHYDGTSWTPYAASDLTYDGTYASFTVTGFSGYAVTTVPEPGTLALLLAAGLGLLAYVRRRRSQGNADFR